MKNENVQLIELSGKTYDLMISPMSMSYIPSESDPDTSSIHRHDYNSLFILEKGSVTMVVDNQYITMSGSSVLHISKGQVHQPVETSDIKGWVMVFDEKILDPEILNSLERTSGEITLFSVDEADFAFLNNLLGNVHITVQQTAENPFGKKLLNAMVNAVYYKLADMYWSVKTNALDRYGSRPVQITQDFKRLVRSHFRDFKKPSSYAEMLNISTTYLNDTVKKHTGFPSTSFIQQEIVAEAQRQLLYTNKSVKEIAYDLGFVDWKYFLRLFSKVTGRSPTLFRKKAEPGSHDKK